MCVCMYHNSWMVQPLLLYTAYIKKNICVISLSFAHMSVVHTFSTINSYKTVDDDICNVLLGLFHHVLRSYAYGMGPPSTPCPWRALVLGAVLAKQLENIKISWASKSLVFLSIFCLE